MKQYNEMIKAATLIELLEEQIETQLSVSKDGYDRHEVNERVRNMRKKDRKIFINTAHTLWNVVDATDLNINKNLYNCIAFFRDVNIKVKKL